MEGATTGATSFVEVGKRLVELVGLHALDVQIEAFKERLVEMAPDGIAPVLVQLPRITEQIKGAHQHLDADRQLRC